MRRLAHITVGFLALSAGLSGCGSSHPSAPQTVKQLRLVTSYDLAFTEPSDLTINDTGTTLWTVTNNPDSVFQLDLVGNHVKSLKYAGQDLEGIAYDRSDQTLWVTEENLRQVVHLDLDGNVLKKYPLGLTGEQNSGLEGICIDTTGHLFVLNEKRPGLFITLNDNVAIATIDTLTFAGDYSGLSYDPPSGAYWIVSDMSKRLYLWSRTAGIIKEYPLPFSKGEGVAYDPTTNLIYIVSDSEHRLYIYENVEQN